MYATPVVTLTLLALGGCRSDGADTGEPPETVESGETDETAGSGETGDTGETGGDTAPDRAVTLVEPGFANFLLPELVAFDEARGLAYVTSNMFPLLAQVDVASGQVLQHLSFGAENLDPIELVAAPDGAVWLILHTDPWVIRVDPATGTSAAFSPGLDQVAMATLLGDHVVVGGPAMDRTFHLVEVAADGAVLANLPLTADPSGLTQAPDGTLAVLLRGDAPGVYHLEPGTLAAGRVCPLVGDATLPTFSARVTPLASGAYVAAYEEDVVLARCDGAPWVVTHVGRSNRTPLEWQGRILVADRYAEEGAANPLMSSIRTFDQELQPVGAPFPTSILAGFLFRDPATDRVWFAAEGGGVVGHVDPAHPDDLTLLRVGQDIDLLGLPAALDDHRVWFTARLTQNVGWVDLRSGEVRRSELLPWPVGGLLADDGYWVVSNTEGRLLRLDPEGLTVEADFPLDVTPSGYLLFDALADAGERGTVLVTVGLDNVLLEIDRATGAEVGRWRLGGAPPADDRDIGRLEIGWLSDHEVVTLRTIDGVATRVDLDTGATVSAQVPPDGEPGEDVQQQQLHVRSDGVVMVRGRALDPATLAPLADAPLPFSYLLGELAPDRWLVWIAATTTLAIVDPAGELLAEQGVPLAVPPDPHLFLDAARDRVVYNDLVVGAVVPVPLAELRAAAGM